MKREQKRQATMQSLLDAAKSIILEKGCANTTLSDIMQRSGLSKGAIFHYVKSKDELFALLLVENLKEINERFQREVETNAGNFAGPFGQITLNLEKLSDPGEVTNNILIYLVSKSDAPEVRSAISDFYDQSVRFAKQWIEAGQHNHVIPVSVDARKTAELFVLLSLGLRMRSGITSEYKSFQTEDFIEIMLKTLQP